MATFVQVPLDAFDRAFNDACDRLELKALRDSNHRAIGSAIESAAIYELHKAFVYEIRMLQARLAKGDG